ncbi:hypothetical protein [Flavobacterium sp. 3HN19-14]|uniref:hypothetical protein n=1 Tax=Flavobacterium sp. 3HN19-14 TaxID=3448133 RepID=UPI003EE2E9D6
MLAAAHIMNENIRKHKEIQDLEIENIQCGNQLASLETVKSFSYDEKNEMRGLYNQRQQETTAKIKQLFEGFEVVGAQTVVHQSTLFSAAG